MSETSPLLPLSDAHFLGSGLQRPACLLCTSGGDIFTADWRGGVAHSRAFGHHEFYRATDGGGSLLPNGISLQRDSSFLLTNLNDAGGVFRLDRDGKLSEVLRKVDGVDLPSTSAVLIDDRNRVWVTAATRRGASDPTLGREVADGFLVLIDGKGARIVADNLGYASELQLDRQGAHLYLNETFGRRLTRFRINRYGEPDTPEVLTTFGPGTFPHGLTMDLEEHLWVTSPVSNRVIRVAPDGGQTLILEDSDPEHLAQVEAAFEAGRMTRADLEAVKSRKLANISSLAFGGRGLRTAFLGCLSGERIAFFRSPVMGRPPTHWHFNA
ncbi:MAG: hypothetical protein Tsb0032_38480 [Kiloniellaceae bacterium]